MGGQQLTVNCRAVNDKQMNTYRQIQTQTDRLTDRQTDTGRQTDRQTGRQTQTYRHRETE